MIKENRKFKVTIDVAAEYFSDVMDWIAEILDDCDEQHFDIEILDYDVIEELDDG